MWVDMRSAVRFEFAPPRLNGVARCIAVVEDNRRHPDNFVILDIHMQRPTIRIGGIANTPIRGLCSELPGSLLGHVQQLTKPDRSFVISERHHPEVLGSVNDICMRYFWV